ncbi:MAG TPA: P-loop NTPase [Bacteroidota bacterium]|nr:P-loop NTPase [Bacteroidota bacterium]
MREAYVIEDQATRLREIALHASLKQPRHNPFVVAIASGKGGVGKSTVALNTAITLSDLGNRVLLIDADHNMGNLHIMIGEAPRYNLADVLRGERDIEDVLLHPLPRLDILPGNSGDFNSPPMTEAAMKNFLHDVRALETEYDIILIDLSAGLSGKILAACLEADEAIIVTNDQPTAVMDAYAVIKMITAQQPQHAVSVVMSGAESPIAADDAMRKLQIAVEHFLHRNIQYLGTIPFDKNLQRAIQVQVPLVRLYPSSSAALNVAAIARQIVKKTTVHQTERTL